MADTTFVSGHYLSRAWRMMTQDKGWLAPVCILALCLFVPIVGALGAAGYALCWARLTAWGVDAAPKQRGVRVGECIGAGWRAFVVSLVWGLLASAVTFAIAWLLDLAGTPGNVLSSILVWAIDIFVGLFVLVANLRACIYQKIGAGFGFSQIWTMYSHDLGGLFRILGIVILGSLAATIPVFLAVMAMIPSFVSLAWSSYYGYAMDHTAYILGAVAAMLQSAVLPMLVASFITNVISVITMLLTYTAGALWIRQFNVPAWGSPSDPVPLTPNPQPLPGPYSPAPQPAPQPQQPPVAQAAPTAAPEAQPAPHYAPQPAPSPEPAAPAAQKIEPQPPVISKNVETEDVWPADPEPASVPLVLEGQESAETPEPEQDSVEEDLETVDLEEDEGEDGPEPPVPGMGCPMASEEEEEIVTPLIVHGDEKDEE